MQPAPRWAAASPTEDAGVGGNARLTATVGIVLFIVLGLEGLTILSIRRLLGPHAFIGFLLIPPLVLKLASTGYRFARYYTRDTAYRLAGPPQIVMRLDAPILVATTTLVVLSGVILWFAGNPHFWLTVHKGSFVLWFFATAIHVLGYLERAPSLMLDDLRDRPPVRGASTRRGLVLGSLVLGLVIGVVAVMVWATPFRIPVEQ